MSNYKSYLTEAMSTASAEKAGFIIAKYLKKKTGVTLFKLQGTEEFRNSLGKGFGMRFFSAKKNMSLRFNWSSSSLVGLVNLKSIDFWNGKIDTPFHIEFDETVSIIKTLPIIADIINDGGHPVGPIRSLPDGIPLNEARGDTPDSIFTDIMDLITDHDIKKGDIRAVYYDVGVKIFDQIALSYPALIVKVGAAYSWEGKPRDLQTVLKNKDSILDSIGAVSGKVTKGPAKETYKPVGNVEDMEENIDRLSFEAQLKDLEHLTKLTIGGASNALFVAGRGGCLSADTEIVATIE